MENGDEERHTQTNGDARHNNDCGKQEDASTSSLDSNRELGAKCKTKCIPYNIPSVSHSGKLNNADGVRKVRRRRAVDFEKVNKSRFGNLVHEEDVSESDEDEADGPARQRNGHITSVEGEFLKNKSEKPDNFRLDSYLRNNVAGFEPNLNKCPDKKEEPESKLNLSSDSDNDGDVEEEDEEDDGLSADECCIYTYRGDREGVADLPFLFGVDGQDAENAAIVDAMGNIGRRLGDAAPPRCSSPEMDFLEMDFDPGPPTGRDSDESGRDSQEECDGAEAVCARMNPDLPPNKQMELEGKDIHPKKCHTEEVCHSVGHNSPLFTMSPSPPPVSHQPSNNLSLPHAEKVEVQEENLMANVPSEGAMPCLNTQPNLPSASADKSKGAVPKIIPLNLVTEPRAPSNSHWVGNASPDDCRRQLRDGIRLAMKQEMVRSAHELIFAGVNGSKSLEVEEGLHQNEFELSVKSPSHFSSVFNCLQMPKQSCNKAQPKLLQVEANSNLAHCHGHKKAHGEHVSDCGAADVIVNALSALDVPVQYAKVQQGLCMAMPSGYSGKSAPPNGLVEYLEWRANCKGAPSQIEIAKSIEWASEGAVVSRFFPASSPAEGGKSAYCCSSTNMSSLSSTSTCPESSSSSYSSNAQMAGVNLMDWLYYWMKRGAVPIVTLNSQDWIGCMKSSSVENPDHSRVCGFSERSGAGSNSGRGGGMEEGERWVHQIVIGLGPRGAYLSGCANEQCCAEVRSLACLIVNGETIGVHVSRAEVVARWRAGSNDLRPLANPRIPEWRRANVLGAVVSAVRESCSSVPRSSSSSSASTSSSSSTSATPLAISPASPLGVSATASLSSPSSNSPFIILPMARHRTGITLIMRRDSYDVGWLMAAPDAALSQILSPSSSSIPHVFENAPVNTMKTSVCASPVNGNAFSSHASLPKSQARSQDSN
ncbi:uncharacterized protein [Hetaerina americana]|uniref:uncharacterized protein n=1 Tax=Hetaerina americana TaxID=62018 RepID=UPI003A7F51CB